MVCLDSKQEIVGMFGFLDSVVFSFKREQRYACLVSRHGDCDLMNWIPQQAQQDC